MAKNMIKADDGMIEDKSFDLALIDKEVKIRASEFTFRDINLKEVERRILHNYLTRLLDRPFKEYRGRFFKKFLKAKHQLEVTKLNEYLKTFSGKKKWKNVKNVNIV